MTREEARIKLIEIRAQLEVILSMYGLEISDVFDIAIEALSAEPCEDCISRQAVRHILNHEVKMPIKVWKKLFELVDCLPSVIPKPKVGRWINIEDRTDWYDVVYKCSCCGREIITPYELKDNLYNDYPYCHCGAKMESEDKE